MESQLIKTPSNSTCTSSNSSSPLLKIPPIPINSSSYFPDISSTVEKNNTPTIEVDAEFTPRGKLKKINFDGAEADLFYVAINIPKDTSKLKSYLHKHKNTIKESVLEIFEEINITKDVTLALKANEKLVIYINFESYPIFIDNNSLKAKLLYTQSRIKEIQKQSENIFSVNYNFKSFKPS